MERQYFVSNFQPLKKIILPYFQNLMRAPMIGLDISHVVNGQEVGTAVPQLTWFLITWYFILVLKNSYNVILVHNRITLWKFFETENSLLTNSHQLLITWCQLSWCLKKITITLAEGLLYFISGNQNTTNINFSWNWKLVWSELVLYF